MLSGKLGLGIIKTPQIRAEEQLRIFKKAGFDAFFSQYGDNTGRLRRAADELGLEYHAIHAPFVKMRHLWYPSEETEPAKEELKACLGEAARHRVPVVVMHPFIGFDVNQATEFGVRSFREVVDEAKARGVKIAFENVEGEAYLEALMEAFKAEAHVGFCWDTGHEMCYNRHKDMLSRYGDRLFTTHINDNLGVTGGEITFLDDLHLIPFDGVKDWQNAVSRLEQWGYRGALMLELVRSKERDAKGGTKYAEMEFAAYVERAYQAGRRLMGLSRPGR